MDLTESIAPRSDQVNADDLVGGPQTFTVREVKIGKAEQPFDFMLVETDRAYRPSKTMRRLIVAAWGPDSSAYAGKRLTLYRDPSIRFGGAVVGGIRISAMSGITKRLEEKFQTTRGKRETFVVEPLPDLPIGATKQQLEQIVSAFAIIGITDKTAMRDYCANVVERPLTSATELSDSEVSRVLDALRQDAQGDDGTLGVGQ